MLKFGAQLDKIYKKEKIYDIKYKIFDLFKVLILIIDIKVSHYFPIKYCGEFDILYFQE